MKVYTKKIIITKKLISQFRKLTKDKTGKKPFTNINLVKI